MSPLCSFVFRQQLASLALSKCASRLRVACDRWVDVVIGACAALVYAWLVVWGALIIGGTLWNFVVMPLLQRFGVA